MLTCILTSLTQEKFGKEIKTSSYDILYVFSVLCYALYSRFIERHHCRNSVCVCYRKLHKDEVRRQREKAVNKSIDSDSGSDMEIDSGFSVPGRIWNKLYRCIIPVPVFVLLYRT